MSSSKPRVVKDYEKLSEDIQARVKIEYPRGFAGSLISYTDAKGQKVSALPFETEEFYYLIRMTVQQAKDIIKDDDDYDDDGVLRSDFEEEISGVKEDDAEFDTDDYSEDPDYGDEPEDDGDDAADEEL